MRKQYASKSTLFLMELVIVLLFFSLCAASCASMFGSAQQMARYSHNLSAGVVAARSAASCYKSAEGDIRQAVALLEGRWEQQMGCVYYDKQWQQVRTAEESSYYLQIKPLAQAGEAEIAVYAIAEDAPVFTLPVKSGRGGGQHEQ